MALLRPRTREERARTLAPVVLFFATRGKENNIILSDSCCRPHHNDPPTRVGVFGLLTHILCVGGITGGSVGRAQ